MSITANKPSSAIDFSKTFGSKSSAPATTDRPKTQFWLNIGYDSGIKDDQGNSRFVSLPVGIPLDTQDRLPTNSRNADFAQFQAARNNLADQIAAAAAQLKPGEEKLLNLQIQLRRINDEQAEAPLDQNQFARDLSL